MMTRNVYRLVLIVGIGLILFSRTNQLQAQGGISETYDSVVSAMQQGRYDEGLEEVNELIAASGESGKKRYGPVFGHFYYLKGMLLIRKKEYEKAIEPLRISYEEFSNDDLQKGDMANHFQIHALMQWAGCLQALGRYEEAIEKYKQTLAEDPRREPRINRLFVQVNLARCLSKTGNEEEGQAILKKVLNLEGLSDEAMEETFLAMASDWAPGQDATELFQLLEEHSGDLLEEGQTFRAGMNPRLAGLAAKALREGQPLQALKWYNLMAAPTVVMEELESRKATLVSRREAAQAQNRQDIVKRADELIEELDTRMETARESQANAMLGMAAAHYQIGSFAAARAVYEQLLEHFPRHPARPLMMHNFIICNTNLAQWDEAYEAGMTFMEAYPDHELKAGVARVLVEVIFLKGDLEEAYRFALDARQGLVPGEAERDIPDFVAGASLYQLGKYSDAEAELENYVSLYPEGERIESARFFLGSAKVKLGKWPGAAAVLGDFADTFQQSSERPTALYLAALSYLIQDELDLSLIRVNQLLKDYPRANEVAGCYNIKGDILSAQSAPYEEIAGAYLRAKTLSESGIGSPDVAAYALRQLIAAASGEEDWITALTFFEEFQDKHENSPLRGEVTVAALDALVAEGRMDEGRELLEELLNELARDKDLARLDETFRSYLEFLKTHYEPDEVLDRLRQFPFDAPAPAPALEAWLVAGEIEILQEREEVDRKRVTELFYRLNALYAEDGEELSNATLIQLAQWNLQEREEREMAAGIYDLVISRNPSGGVLGRALLDTARMDAASGESDRRQLAMRKFSRVIEEVEDAELRQEAVLGIARILTEEERWADAQQWWERFVAGRVASSARPEANYSYALCLDRQGKTEEAMKVYISVYANFPGHLDWSTKAYLRTAEILKASGRDAEALKVLQDMLRRMKDLDHPGIYRAKEVFFQWRDEFVNKK